MAKRLLYLFLTGAILIATIQFAAGFRELAAGSASPATGKIVEVGDVKIHVDMRGSGPDLVLLHGASGNTRDLTFSLADKLAERYRVIIMDRPGLGWSEQPDGYGVLWSSAGESPTLQAELLRKAADQVGVTNPLVLGHSFGGAVAMAWAQRYEDTSGLIMVAAVSHPWPGDLGWTYRWNGSVMGGALFVPLVSAFVPKWYVENTVAGIFAPASPPEGYIDYVGTGLSLRRATLRANARQVLSLRPYIVEMHETYPDLKMPIEIVHGDADETVPLAIHSQPLAERAPTANLVILEGVGHMPQHEAEDEVIAAIDRAAQRAGLR